jgi:hypothetical protein
MENINIHAMIKERFAKLPPKLQTAITSTEVAEKLRTLSQKYRLHLDQGQILENETYMVLLGIEKAGKYEENIKKELGISTEEAKNIAGDVAKEIFLSIRDLLKESTTSTVAQKPQPAPKSTPKPISAETSVNISTPTPVSMPTPKPAPSVSPISTLTSASTLPSTSDQLSVTPTSSIRTPVTTQNKLESVVRNPSKEIKISPTKGYSVDPYREPID